MAQQHIVVRGARTHNLQNIDVHIPRDAFVVMTGLSGSGKSSLAFDTIFAEGQRRYVESLSSYARQFLGQMDKPDVDAIEGLSPAVAIDQKTTSRNPRSTVGTVTEIYDYLRLLYARIGVPHCPTHDIAIQMQTIEQMVDRILAYGEDEKLIILSPVVASKKGEHTKTLESIKKQGFVRVRINGDIVDVHQDIQLPKHRQHTIDIVIDRLIVRAHDAARLAESLETAVRHGDGTVIVHRMSSNEDVVMSAKSACPKCGLGIGVLEPRMFSFNSPLGACPTCGGLGVRQQVDLRRVCPDDSLTLNEGALLPWTAAEEQKYFPMYLKAACAFLRIDMNTPVRDIHKEKWKELLYGDVETMHTLQFSYVSSFGEQRKAKTPFVGLIPQLEARYASAQAREYVSEYMTEQPCEACAGKRLSPLVLAVRIQGASIYDVTQLSIKEAVAFMDALDLPPAQRAIAAPIVSEIRARLSFLCNVGLDYLTLGRSAATLSGGESQRIRLATQIGSQLSGVLYVLDEPSIGLHQRDNDRLIATLKHMRDLGNTLLVVEHDEDTIRACDFVVDVGPGAGVHGGHIVATGTPDAIAAHPESLTGAYLSGRKMIPVPQHRRTPKSVITMRDVSTNNLQHVTVEVPLGVFVCVTGVSGSGKSSLVTSLLHSAHWSMRSDMHVRVQKITGHEKIDRCLVIDQTPIGRSPRSNAVTYTGVFDLIRDQFAQAHIARQRGYTKGRFSFNTKGGRCEACQGDGIIKIEMHFLPDVYVPCEVCKGSRYNRETLEVLWQGQTIADVLNMTVEAAREFFTNNERIVRVLDTLIDVGLGYITLGQSATTLSGGEAQRLKLAAELQRTRIAKRGQMHTLIVMDEPTTGLHAHDIARLLTVLQQLVDGGVSILVIEHQLDVIKCADWIIDVGPDGGASGGTIVATGTPEHIATVEASSTGQYLARTLARTCHPYAPHGTIH